MNAQPRQPSRRPVPSQPKRLAPPKAAPALSVVPEDAARLPESERVVFSQGARRRLRGEDGVLPRAVEEARELASDFFYVWTVDEATGQRVVEGCSVEGARMLERVWGNCATLITEEEDDTHWRFTATFIDKEQGLSLSRLFRQRKSSDGDDRSDDGAYQLGQSKAIRNVILDAMPAWLVRECMRAARSEAFLREAAVKEWPKYLEKLRAQGVSEDLVRARLGLRHGVDPLPADIATLAAIGKAIQASRSTLEAEFHAQVPSFQPAPRSTSSRSAGS